MKNLTAEAGGQPSPPPPGDSIEFEVGALVHLADTPIDPCTVRVVVGVGPNRTCLTTYVAPPPWLTEGFYQVDADRLALVPESVAQDFQVLPSALSPAG